MQTHMRIAEALYELRLAAFFGDEALEGLGVGGS